MQLPRAIYRFLDGLPSGTMVFSRDGSAVYANPAARVLLGAVAEVAAPLDFFLSECGDSVAADEHPVAVALRERRASGWRVLGVQRSAGHAPVWLRVQAAPVKDETGADWVVVSLEEASEERRLRRELHDRERRAQVRDVSSGRAEVCGRAQAHALLARAVVEARDRMVPLAVCLLDLDMFKRLNQAFGRSCGDEVLLHVAETLSSCVREEDEYARLGGGEFLVIVPGMTLREAWLLMERFRERLAQEPVPCTGRPVSVSGGMVLLRDEEDAPALLERADSLLYLAKLDGRNRIVPDASIGTFPLAGARPGGRSADGADMREPAGGPDGPSGRGSDG